MLWASELPSLYILMVHLLSASGDDCLGIHLGGPQASNLGDGNGLVNQTQMMVGLHKLSNMFIRSTVHSAKIMGVLQLGLASVRFYS
jgi:hypothetical protein